MKEKVNDLMVIWIVYSKKANVIHLQNLCEMHLEFALKTKNQKDGSYDRESQRFIEDPRTFVYVNYVKNDKLEMINMDFMYQIEMNRR